MIAQPDVKCFKVEDSYDFIVLGCDGIFDKLSDFQVIRAIWETARKKFTNRDQSVHLLSGAAIETVLKLSVSEKTMDNITVVIVCFKNFRK